MKNDAYIPAAWVLFQLSGLLPDQDEAKAFIRECGINSDQDCFSSTELKRLISQAIFNSNDEHYGHSEDGLRLGSTPLAFRIMNSASTAFEAQKLLEKVSDTFSPNHTVSHVVDGDSVILSWKISGHDHEHCAAAELTHMCLTYSAYNAFVGRILEPKVIYSRSILYTSLLDFSFETNCPVEYNDFTGIKLQKSVLDMPRRAAFDRNAFYNTIKWLLLTDKMRPIYDSSNLPLLSSEAIKSSLDKKIAIRNVDVRQKRRIAKHDTQFSERDLNNSNKITQAMIMLVTTDVSIAEITEELGFSDERSFRRFFKNITNKTPIEYRNCNRSDNFSSINNHYEAILKDVLDRI